MLRALTIAAVVLASASAVAQPRAAWHATAGAPNAGLPAVTVDLGYPGTYLPAVSSPIRLRARAGSAPFDGYIGFHFAIRGRKTYDNSVISRAVLRPRQEWMFETTAVLKRYQPADTGSGVRWQMNPRALVIEWRDRSMGLMATRNLGIPPWTGTLGPSALLPLRVVPAGAALTTASVLGKDAYVERADHLSDEARWYAGFAAVVAPLEVWLDLPKRVREAILGSAVHVVVFGLPRATQTFDEIDRAIVPVTFTSSPGSYRVPWPYGNSESISAPVSWTADAGARTVGSGPLAYLVRSATATWSADENGISRKLPATEAAPAALLVARKRSLTLDPSFRIETAWPRPAQLARTAPAMVLLVFATAMSLAGWLILRKRPRAAATVGLAVAAIAILAARHRVRPMTPVYRFEMTAALGPGLVERVEITRSYGASPLPAVEVDAETRRTAITEGSDLWQDAEVRSASTPVAMGVIRRDANWTAVTRGLRRRELGEGPLVRIRRRDASTIVVDYEAAAPVNQVYAGWLCGEKICSGDTSVPWSARGTATIEAGRRTAREGHTFVWESLGALATEPEHTAHVALLQRTRMRTRSFDWYETATGPRSFVVTDRATSGTREPFVFAVPADLGVNATALVSVQANPPASRVTVIHPGGSTDLEPSGREGLPLSSQSYLVPADVLRAVAASGGVLQVTTATAARSINPYDSASLEIWEKKP